MALVVVAVVLVCVVRVSPAPSPSSPLTLVYRPIVVLLVYIEAFLAVGPAVHQCLYDSTIVYEPRTQSPPAAFLREAPEAVVAERLSGQQFAVDLVEVYHKMSGNKATVWVTVTHPDGPDEWRVFRLLGAASQQVSLDLPSQHVMLCTTGIGGWRIA